MSHQETRPASIKRNRARELRRQSTEFERRLWRYLRDRQVGGFRFRRQHPLGRYVVDFVCLERRLVVELDGDHHGEQQRHDAERDAWLRSDGFTVLRFPNRLLLREPDSVVETILATLKGSVDPPP